MMILAYILYIGQFSVSKSEHKKYKRQQTRRIIPY